MDEMGVYVGPGTAADAIKALADHTPGEWVMGLTDAEGETVWRGRGWSWEIVENDEEAVFAVGRKEQGAGNPAVYMDAPLVLSFAKEMPLEAECDLYTGGLVFRLGFGDYEGQTLTMVAWHSVLHETESGDFAPGLGFAIKRPPPPDEDEGTDS
jgi:hypothetical protein